MTRIRAAKLVPPAPPTARIARSRLDTALAGDAAIVSLAAGAGFGKSSLAAGWARRAGAAAWYAVDADDEQPAQLVAGIVAALERAGVELPDDIAASSQMPGPDADERARAEASAAALVEALSDTAHDLLVVLDDLHHLAAQSPGAAFVEAVARQWPRGTKLVLSSREPLPFPAHRLRGQGLLTDLSTAELAFREDETREFLTVTVAAPELTDVVQALTAGWPAALRLVVEALRTVPAAERAGAVARLAESDGPLLGYLAEEVFVGVSPDGRELLRRAAVVGRFDAPLAAALGATASRELISDLCRRGLLARHPTPAPRQWSLTTLAESLVADRMPLSPVERDELLRDAAAHFVASGTPDAALACLTAAGQPADVAAFLIAQGHDLLAAGHVHLVATAAASVPARWRTRTLDEVEGQARQIEGDWLAALECLRRAAGDAAELPPGLAWRMGLIHHLRGDIDAALEVFESGHIDADFELAVAEGQPDAVADLVQLLAWTASGRLAKGDLSAAREINARAGGAARECRDPAAIAAYHAMASIVCWEDGDSVAAAAHNRRALESAEQAGDVLQVIRIRINRGSQLDETGDYPGALAETEAALRLAEMTGFTAKQALALSNRGDIHVHLGQLDAAVADYRLAKTLYERSDSLLVCYALEGLAGVQLLRGDSAAACRTYEEALAVSEKAGYVQSMVPNLCGLARALAVDDWAAATALAARAIELAEGYGRIAALTASGYAALGRGDHADADKWAQRAAAVARERKDRPGLADSYELAAAVSRDRARSAALLRDAAALRREIGDPIGTARAEFAAEAAAGTEQSPVGRDAAARLASFGIRPPLQPAAGRDSGRVSISCLGAFRVLLDDQVVSPSQWQSKKARELLKLLVALRGHPATREYLMECLWPEGDPAALSNRLSVALSTVRSVLDTDHRFPADHFVTTDRRTVALDLTHVDVDLERFFGIATEALRSSDADRLERLDQAVAAYSGDFLEEDRYEDWAVHVREQAAGLHSALLRGIARDAADGGDDESAIRCHLQLLERDPFDEAAHLELVRTLAAATRHGEAHRRYLVYAGAMREMGTEPAAFPELRRRTPTRTR